MTHSDTSAKIWVLLVDDMPATRRNLLKVLSSEAEIQIVGAASSGEEAVEMAVKQLPDIVLLDLFLPGIDGIVAGEQILQQVPSAKIIMMSAYGDSDYRRAARLAGVREYLVKPFTRDELMNSIRRASQPGQDAPFTPPFE